VRFFTASPIHPQTIPKQRWGLSKEKNIYEKKIERKNIKNKKNKKIMKKNIYLAAGMTSHSINFHLAT
jgi:hypothetical protein